MSFTADIYSVLFTEAIEGKHPFGSLAMRKFEYPSGISIVFALETISRTRQAFVSLDERIDSYSFPKWKGIVIEFAELPTYGTEHYVVFKQPPESDDYIFETIIEDIRVSLERTDTSASCFTILITKLTKWKKFFLSDKQLIMPEEKQQGLYGELYFLERCIQTMDSKCVRYWTGPEYETHDFYFPHHTIEIKATSQKEPYKVIISNEYQLDDTDAGEYLYLLCYAFKKSKSIGDTLPDIIERIRLAIINSPFIALFNEKLEHYGFYNEVSESYTTGYTLRDSFAFHIIEGFPRITRNSIQQGISKVVYEISLSQCLDYVYPYERVFTELEGSC